MIKSLFLIIFLFSFSYSKVVVGENLEQFKIKDQFKHSYSLESSTKKVIFAFAKKSGHTVKNLLNNKEKDYLYKRDILFVVDASSMPSFMKIFILPFTGYAYPILTLEDEEVSKRYINEEFSDKIMIVSLDNSKVVDVKYIDDTEELIREIEN